MFVIDIAIVATCISVIGGVFAGIIFIARMYSKFAPLPQKVDTLEASHELCGVKDIDVDKLNENIDTLLRNMEKDYQSIGQLSDRQLVMMEGMLNIFQHIMNGNHVKEIQKSYDQMVKELVKVKPPTERNKP